MKLKLFSLGLLLNSICSFSYMNIDPVIFDKRIDNGGSTQEYHITNITNTPVGYRIYTENPEAKNNMTSWIEYYPRELKLDPGETGKLKVFIEAPENTREGEYISTLGIKEVNIPTSNKKNSMVQIYTNLKMEIAGFVGDLKPKIQIDDLSFNENNLKLKLKNVGEIRTKVEVYISDLKGNNKLFIDNARLLQGKEKKIDKMIKLKDLKSNNLMILILDMEGNKILEKKI